MIDSNPILNCSRLGVWAFTLDGTDRGFIAFWRKMGFGLSDAPVFDSRDEAIAWARQRGIKWREA